MTGQNGVSHLQNDSLQYALQAIALPCFGGHAACHKVHAASICAILQTACHELRSLSWCFSPFDQDCLQSVEVTDKMLL